MKIVAEASNLLVTAIRK